MNERDLRKLLERIEVKYLHLNQSNATANVKELPHTSSTSIFKLSAAQK